MNKRNGKLLTYIFASLLIFSFIMPIFSQSHQVSAWSVSGEGGTPTKPGWGHWYYAESKNKNKVRASEAWEKYYNTQMKVRDPNSSNVYIRSHASLKKLINGAGNGYQYADGTYEPLWDTCKRSDYIWWYGSWEGGAKSIGWQYSLAGRTYHDDITWDNMSALGRKELEAYQKTNKDTWNGGKVILICSGGGHPKTPKPVNVTFHANSGTFKENGENHTVKGLDKGKSSTSRIRDGHKADINATRTESVAGKYPVKFKKANIVDADGMRVNNQYNIKTIEGILKITHNTKTGVPKDRNDWRCIDDKTDSVTAVTDIKLSGSSGFVPKVFGVQPPSFAKTEKTISTDAKAKLNSTPKAGNKLSKWTTWKKEFKNGSSENTGSLSMQRAADSLRKTGGVYNVSKSLTSRTVEVTHCKPEKREMVEYTSTTTGENGEVNTEVTKEWSKWESDGERLIRKINKNKKTKTDETSYQILLVNCNVDGFNQVLNEFGGKNALENAGGKVVQYANGQGSSVLVTPEKEGTDFTLGKTTHKTGKESFYDEKSCSANINCTSDILRGAEHDSKDNLGGSEYTQDGNAENKPGNNGLIFFRDNKNRLIRTDVYYPKASGHKDIVIDPKKKAIGTATKVFQGTPEAELVSFSTTKSPETKKEKSEGPKPINELSLKEDSVNGYYNKFILKSQWASDKGKPYEIGVNWKYKPSLYNTVPIEINGKGVTKTKDYKYDIDAYCEFKNSGKAVISEYPYYNGSRVTPKFDRGKFFGVIFNRAASDE